MIVVLNDLGASWVHVKSSLFQICIEVVKYPTMKGKYQYLRMHFTPFLANSGNFRGKVWTFHALLPVMHESVGLS